MGKYVVRQGDCLATLAFRQRADFDALLNENAHLRQGGRDPYVLQPGEVLDIPDAPPPQLSITAGATNRFKAVVPRATLKLHVEGDDGPRANERFTFSALGLRSEGTSDGDGVVELQVPVQALEGELVIGEGEHETQLRIQFGHLNPIDDDVGLAQRLRNLGFLREASGGTAEQVATALRAFQASRRLSTTGEPDEDTRAALLERHRG